VLDNEPCPVDFKTCGNAGAGSSKSIRLYLQP